MAAVVESTDCLQRMKDGNARYVAGQLKPKGCGDPGHRDFIDAGQAPKIGLVFIFFNLSGCTVVDDFGWYKL